MQMQFEQQSVRCLRQAIRKTAQQEATQEIRLDEEMPDIADVLGCWGQVLLRSKQWRGTDMQISGGVMVWALYRPEDGSMPQWVNGWIPFQADLDFNREEKDGVIRVLPQIVSVDARSISTRKLLVRAQIQLQTEALVEQVQTVYCPPEKEDKLQVLKRTYPLLLPAEAGEKSFTLEEELTLPASCPPVEKILSFRCQPELIDQKVLSDKVVFRGCCIVHTVYLGQDGLLRCWDFEVPFSQYCELSNDYEQDAQVDFWLAVTAMELEMAEDGRLLLKAGLTGQYVLFQRQLVSVAEDAYVPGMQVKTEEKVLDMPSVLENTSMPVALQLDMQADVAHLADILVQPSQPVLRREADRTYAQLTAKVQVVYYDRDGQLQTEYKSWQSEQQIQCDGQSELQLQVCLSGKPQLMSGAPQIKADMQLHSQAWSKQGLCMVSALQAEEKTAVRPSLIIRSAEEDLWTLAKQCDSTVEAIEKANELSQPPQMGTLLLIPVVV